MTLGILGRKKGLTQIFDENGIVITVTVIEAGPCTVIQRKTTKIDGYNAIQVGFGAIRPALLTKAMRQRFEKLKLACLRDLKEFRVSNVDDFAVGQTITVAGFKPGDSVDVQGVTKGRGFQGVMKKEGKHGGPDGHGSGFHRRPGSIGMRTWPGKVLKNMGMPGRMGAEQVMIRHLSVVDVKLEENLILVKGSVPGHREGLVVIFNREADFESRFKQEAAPSIEAPQPQEAPV
ncbi:MAG: 50S ribosomal protein L3 [Deltaproteobacteria bacterium]|nr:50S ribosomal protein L3 [Deltaproteobacteria bacterium]